MTDFSKHTELIDAYLSGTLSTTEESSFMDLINTDPVLRDEFLFQQSIVGGLREYRKTELKERLNSITVGVGLLGFLMSFSGYKLLAAVLTLGIIGVGTYYSFDVYLNEGNEFNNNISSLPPKDADFPQPLVIDLAVIEDLDKGIILSEATVITNANESDDKKLKVQQKKVTKRNKKEFVQEDNLISVNSNEKKVDSPIFTLPTVEDEQVEGDTPAGIDISDEGINGIDLSSDEVKERIEVEKIHRNSRSLQYKFIQGKLYLYGDFNGKTYELLEINSEGKRNLYFYFNNQYYNLNQYQKSISELSILSNRRLIKELEIIRNSRD